MFDPTIHAKTIARYLEAGDFRKDPTLFNPVVLQAAVDTAAAMGRNGLAPISLIKSKLRGKDVYQTASLPHKLVLRHVTSNIRRVTGVKQDNRQFIISCISSLVSEGTAFRVYKFDIKSFYESVHVRSIVNDLSSDLAFSGQSVRALQSLFAELELQGIAGLPRGMAVSATLAEYLLRPFDAEMSNSLGVWYYSRFVDDILVITDGLETPAEFTALASTLLPSGLRFNDKSKHFTFLPFKKNNPNVTEDAFNFLGYNFTVGKAYRDPGDKKVKRTVTLDIAPSKVLKIKSRIAKSLLTFRADANFNDLIDRFKILSGNFNFVDSKTGTRRSSGIYFNYPLISSNPPSLVELDRFVRASLLATTPKNKIRPAITAAQRLALLRLSFRGGHEKRRFFAFSSARLAELTGCWRYV